MRVATIKAFYFTKEEINTIRNLFSMVQNPEDVTDIAEALWEGSLGTESRIDGTVYELNDDRNIDAEPEPEIKSATKTTKKKKITVDKTQAEINEGL